MPQSLDSTLSTSCYPPGLRTIDPMGAGSPHFGASQGARQPMPAASRIPLHKVKDQKSEDRSRTSEGSPPGPAILSQLAFHPSDVGRPLVEPPLVEPTGIEPATPCLQSRCS